MEYKHNIVHCDVCELADHIESMKCVNCKHICRSCLDVYERVKYLKGIKWHKTTECQPEINDVCFVKTIYPQSDDTLFSLAVFTKVIDDVTNNHTLEWKDKSSGFFFAISDNQYWVRLSDLLNELR